MEQLCIRLLQSHPQMSHVALALHTHGRLAECERRVSRTRRDREAERVSDNIKLQLAAGCWLSVLTSSILPEHEQEPRPRRSAALSPCGRPHFHLAERRVELGATKDGRTVRRRATLVTEAELRRRSAQIPRGLHAHRVWACEASHHGGLRCTDNEGVAAKVRPRTSVVEDGSFGPANLS